MKSMKKCVCSSVAGGNATENQGYSVLVSLAIAATRKQKDWLEFARQPLSHESQQKK